MTAFWPTVGLLVNASVFVNTLRCNYFESAKDRPCIWSQEDTLLMSLSGLVSEESRLQGLRPENGRDRVREAQSCRQPRPPGPQRRLATLAPRCRPTCGVRKWRRTPPRRNGHHHSTRRVTVAAVPSPYGWANANVDPVLSRRRLVLALAASHFDCFLAVDMN